MSLTIVVGGQFGSESKAKAAVHLAKWIDAVECAEDTNRQVVGVRCGGPNAGHTVYVGNTPIVLRLVPSLVVIPTVQLRIAAGAMVDVALLKRELETLDGMGLEATKRLQIDPETAIVHPDFITEEKMKMLGEAIGSTQTGTGAAAAARALRKTETAARSEGLNGLVSGSSLCYSLIDACDNGHVIIEGTQGFGLSLYHAGYYPYCTSKPAISSNFLMEAGIPPQKVTRVVMVIRTYPIRVGGNSGPMDGEIDWATIEKRSGSLTPILEKTSVTKKVRRVAEFDLTMVKNAAKVNGATELAVHGLDYLEHTDYGVKQWRRLSDKSKSWVRWVEGEVGIPVTMAFTGKHQMDVVNIP